MSKPVHPEPPSMPRHARVVGSDTALVWLIAETLAHDGWAVSPDGSGDQAPNWLVHATSGSDNDATPILASLRAFAGNSAGPNLGGIVLVLDLRHAQPRAGEAPPPFAPAFAQRSLAAAVPMLALEFAPHLRVNAIGCLRPAVPPAFVTPEEDIAAALRFIIDAPALTGQMIALDGGRTALVPAPGLGTPERP